MAFQYVAELAQSAFHKIGNTRGNTVRAGYALTLGCLHRYGGSLGSGHHLNTAMQVVMALAQEAREPFLQSWALIALTLIAETGGGNFAGYIENVLGVCLTLLLNTPLNNVDVIRSIGKLLTVLMTCVGPELSFSSTIDGVRTALLASCAIQVSFLELLLKNFLLQLAHEDSLVKTEAMTGLQQMHLFAPRHVDLAHLVVDIAS